MLRPLTRDEWQPWVDRVIEFVPGWQRGLIERAGRLTLIKTVITAKPVHQLLVIDAPIWAIKEVEKWLKAFF